MSLNCSFNIKTEDITNIIGKDTFKNLTQEECESTITQLMSSYGLTQEDLLDNKYKSDIIAAIKRNREEAIKATLANIETEMQHILKNAPRDSEGNLLAPNGKKSNLTERQYAQVRTKAFKDWFGDWELIAYDNAELNSIPNLRKIDVDSFLEMVDNRLEKDWITTGYLNRESVEVIKKLFNLSKTQLYQGDIKEKGLSFYTGAIVLNTMPMEEAAQVFVHEILHSYTTYAYDTDATFRKEIDKYHKIALNHNSGFNKDVYEFMANTLEPYHMVTLLEIPSENNSSNLLKDIINSFVKHIRAFFRAYETNKKRTLFHDIIETIYNHKRNNSESINDISKVVDENDEPLVVYHGSAKQFNAFKTDKIGSMSGDKSGFYFTNKRKIAKDYYSKETGSALGNLKLLFHIGSEYKSSVYDVFLNSKNPYVIKVSDKEYINREQIIKEAREQGYDSVLFNNVIDGPTIRQDVRIVFNPNQIKSATNNVGTFSRTDDRIDYFETNNSEKVVESQEALDILKKEGITLDNSLIDKYLLEVKASNPYHQIFKQIIGILNNNNIPINIVVNSNLSNIAARKQDGFKTATIEINPALLLDYLMTDNKDNIKENLMKILTHELVHAVTAEILNYHPSWAKIKNFNEAQTEFSNNVWNLYLQCKEQLKGTKWYGLTNAKEFIAVALTDRDFQIELSKIKLDKNENAFKRFINYLTDLFNKVFKAQGIDIKNSALEEIISISQEYFNSANKNLRGGIYDYTGTRDYYDNNESFTWDVTSDNSYEVSTLASKNKMSKQEGDARFSALNAIFKKGTIIDGVDVGGMTIEDVYQKVIKKSGKGKAPAKDSKLYNEALKTKEEREDFSYTEGYLPLWQEWARQNPELIEELRENARGKTLTDNLI